MTTDRNSEGAELLPCPFCGEGANIGAWKQAVERHPDATAIECSNGLADCEPNPSVCCYSRDEAIAAWNRRASPSAAEVQALVEGVQKLVDAIDGMDHKGDDDTTGPFITYGMVRELAKLIPRNPE